MVLLQDWGVKGQNEFQVVIRIQVIPIDHRRNVRLRVIKWISELDGTKED